ncbi:MAG: C25 family cysteine peptidase [Candidatus Ancillula sp.]|jgi:hypothetical protein|nr:C25 family cysteine peptidase [Candidatus Ancillula sp.]
MVDGRLISFHDGQAFDSNVLRSVTCSYGENFATVEYKLDGLYNVETDENQNYFEIPDTGMESSEGVPYLPVDGLFVLLPEWSNGYELSITEEDYTALDGEYDIAPTPKQILETQELDDISPQVNVDIYESDAVFPTSVVQDLGELRLLNEKVAHILVKPVRYYPKRKKIEVLTNFKFTLRINTNSSESKVDSTKNLQDLRPDGIIKDLVVKADEFAQDSQIDAIRKNFLIITTDKLEYYMRVFEGVKQNDYDTSIVTVEKIKKKYPSLSTADALRKYIKDENAKSAISYVLLGGDLQDIPSALASNDYNPAESKFLSDVFFVTDDINKVPFCSIGRMPVSDGNELYNLCDFAAYYNRFYTDKRKSAIFTAYYGTEGYIENKKGIAASSKSKINIIDRYDKEHTKDELIKAINSGVGFINYRGHGSNSSWQSSNGIVYSDLPKLKVDRQTPIVFSIACNNNALTDPKCLGKGWINAKQAINYLGASAPSYRTTNNWFDTYIWEAICSKNISIVGDIYLYATVKLYQNYPDKATTTNIKEYILLGDPTVNYQDSKS